MKSNWMYAIPVAVFSLMLFTDSTCLKNEEEDDCFKNRLAISEDGELLVGGTTMYIFSVANMNNGIADGDKNCHASMELQFWFKDTLLAKTPEKPPIQITFFGGGGSFDPGSVVYESAQYEPNGRYFWTAICNQAAKNAPSNPVDFGIWVEWDLNQMLNWHDVGFTALISYSKYTSSD